MNQHFKKKFLLALVISLAFVACNQSDKTEATKVTDSLTSSKPATEPATAVPDADSMGIRIMEATYNPGDSSVWHSHPDYAIYTLEGGMGTFYAKDGSKMDHEMKAGTITIHPAEVHSVKNIGKTAIKVILFEVNRPMGTMNWDAAKDAAKVAPNEYKVAADTMGIRVLQINYKPGESSAIHSHPDQALYVLEGTKAEFTDKDGKKMVMEFKKGMTMVIPGATHSVKNIGTATMKAILVEVSRPAK